MNVILRGIVMSTFLLIPAIAFAQGSGSTEKPKGKAPERNFAITKSFAGAVSSVSEDNVAVKNRVGKIATFILTPKTKRGNGCLAAGKHVTVTYYAKDRRAASIRCR